MGAAVVTRDAGFGRARWRTLPPLVAAGLVALVLARVGRWPSGLGLGVALAAVVLAGALGLVEDARIRRLAPLPLLAGLLALTAGLPTGPGYDLLAGAGGVVFLAWIAEDAARPAGGTVRGAIGWGLPGLAVGLAWVSSFLLPPAAAPIGVAGGLLAAIVILLALLFERPELVTSEPAPTL